MIHTLALGDSYTIGEAVAAEARWPEQWARMMQAEGFAINQPVAIIAKTGWSTDELQQAIAEAGDLGQWDLVTLQIGVNNQYRGRSLENFRIEFKQLLETCMSLVAQNPARMQVLSIPDWGQTPFGAQCGRDLSQISAEIEAFNAACQLLCQAYGVGFLDISELTRRNSRNLAMHADDGLHPSEQMYQLWACALLSQGNFGRLIGKSRERV